VQKKLLDNRVNNLEEEIGKFGVLLKEMDPELAKNTSEVVKVSMKSSRS
jgi:hypothetical protein